MMWSEFVEGTQCRETEHNEAVFKRVEALYMADEAMTKEEAYTIAKMWIDNSLTEEEVAYNDGISEQIREEHEHLAQYERWTAEAKESVKNYRQLMKGAKEEVEMWTRSANEVKAKIAELEGRFITA